MKAGKVAVLAAPCNVFAAPHGMSAAPRGALATPQGLTPYKTLLGTPGGLRDYT